MTGAIVGYARTSTTDQQAGLDAQIAELKAAGATRIFSEQVSSVDAVRPQLNAALEFLREGDQFICTRPDRLARSTVELLKMVEDMTARGVVVKLLSMDIDTSSATGKLMLTLLGGVAAFERDLMLERQRHGIAAAKAAGKYKGRQPTARAKSKEVLTLLAEGKSVADIVRATAISRASAYRIIAAG
ncbi:putative DNA-invertase from lambdoid prophage Rac [compost metagenome]